MAVLQYSIGMITPAAAAGAPYAELINPSTTAPVYVREFDFALDAATQTRVGLYIVGQAAATGTIGTGTVNTHKFPATSNSAGTISSTSQMLVSWTAAPTLGANQKAQHLFDMPATIGARIHCIFALQDFSTTNLETKPQLIIPPQCSLVVWNPHGSAAGSIAHCTISFVEGLATGQYPLS